MLTAAILAVCYALNLWLTYILRERADGVGTIWSANAFVIGAMLVLPTRWSAACLLVGFGLQTTMLLSYGNTPFDSVSYALLNVVEAAAVAELARRQHLTRLTTPGRFARLVFFALAPVVLVCAALLGVAMLYLFGEFPFEMLAQRVPAKLLGMSLILPAILLIWQRGGAMRMSVAPWEYPLVYGLVAIVLGLAYTPMSVVAMLLMFPVVTLLGVRMGPNAVTLAVAMVSLVMLSIGLDHSPVATLKGFERLDQQIILTQVYLAMLFATGAITALVARHQMRLRALMARRSANYRRARDRARSASIAKTDFLATMSHEIRTPLNAILGFAQVLDRREDVQGEVRHQLGLIQRAGGSLLTVVNDILDFSKVEAGRIELDPKPVDLAATCQEAMAIVAESAAEKGLSLDLVVTGDSSGRRLCDDHRLCQVLLNYLNNAVKFTDVGGITVELRITPGEAHDGVYIAVRDTGVGIEAAAAEQLFERFSQVDSSVSRRYGGTGLGLAISKGLIEAMGGRVGLESKPGSGSTFWLELDLERCADDAAGATDDQGGEATLAARVLLVDDHPMNRELGQAILTLLGCEIDLACDGREAIEAAGQRRYDAILMDVHMPVLDGLAATRAIRGGDGPSSRTPIIAMSADVLPEQVARMHGAGMVANVGKPLNIGVLQATLAHWVGRDADGKEASAA